MTDQKNSDNPPNDAKGEPPGQTPVTPTAPKKGKMSEKGKATATNKEDVSTELAREFRWVEASQIAISAALLIVGIVALCIYYGQLGEMRKSTKAARDAADAAKQSADGVAKQLDLSERPWINLDMGTSPVTIDQQGLTTRIGIRLKNTGNSPATGLRFRAIIIQSPMGENAPSETIKGRDSLCNDARKEISNGNDSEGETIFPNSEGLTRYIGMTIPRSDVDRAIKNYGGVIPMIVTCAADRSTFNDKIHTTAKVFMIMRRDPATGTALLIVPPREGTMTLPPNQFVVPPSFVAAIYAD